MNAGTSALAGPEVAAFYSSWMNYSTLKDFAWADKYNPATAPNRKVRKWTLLGHGTGNNGRAAMFTCV